MKVKVCGITNQEDASAAVEFGVDASARPLPPWHGVGLSAPQLIPHRLEHIAPRVKRGSTSALRGQFQRLTRQRVTVNGHGCRCSPLRSW